MLLNRLLVASIMLPFLVYLVFFGELSAFIVLELCILIMMLEFYGILIRNGIQVNTRSGVLVSMLIPSMVYFGNSHTYDYLSLVLSMSIIFFIMKRIMNGEIKESLNNISYTLFGILYICVLFSHILLLKNLSFKNIDFFGVSITEGRYWLAMVFFIAFGSDSSAYFAGKMFGKKSMFPKISPNKTVAGFIGSLVYGFVISLYLTYVSNVNIGLSESLFIGLGGTLFAQMGDLGVSLFKREFKVKDTGSILMSHGGLLDRCDSVLFVAPFIYYVVKLAI